MKKVLTEDHSHLEHLKQKNEQQKLKALEIAEITKSKELCEREIAIHDQELTSSAKRLHKYRYSKS